MLCRECRALSVRLFESSRPWEKSRQPAFPHLGEDSLAFGGAERPSRLSGKSILPSSTS